MALTTEDVANLYKRLNDAEAQVKALQSSQNEAPRPHQAENKSPRRASAAHPAPINEDAESVGSPRRTNIRRGSMDSRKTGMSTVVDGMSRRAMSVENSDDSSDSDEGESFFASEPLPREELDEIGLRHHLEHHRFDDYSKLILHEVKDSDRYERKGSLFDKDVDDDAKDHDAQHHDADVYEVDKDGSPRPKIREESKKSGDHIQLWNVLRRTNADVSATQQAVGRIVVMREPTPLLCAALHYTMNPHFDMDSIFKMLIDDQMNTRSYVNGHLSKDERHQRSIVFVLKYHTLVGNGRTPLLWQNHDDDIERKPAHVPISTCSAVVGLSLAGKYARRVRAHSRKSRQRDERSTLYDPFNPWHVLSVQAFPDFHSDVNVHETKHHYVNGPDAFLQTLLAEYRDAVKRFKELSKAVVDLATPPKEVVFNADLRDDLLFEHGDFKWSRRYFWAAQALQITAEEIQGMISAYEETFNEEFWNGTHKTLFFGTADVSARYNNFRKKITHTQKGFEKEINSLRQVLHKCNADQKHIRMLREWLFSGTSVLESRSARKQDYNIKLLTVVTIIFLPMMFVTSVFGMTNMNPEEGFVRFSWVLISIAVPTYCLIVLIGYNEKLHPMKVATIKWFRKLIGKSRVDKHTRSTRTKDRRRLKPTQQSAINMNLQRRLTDMTVLQGQAVRASFTGTMDTLPKHRDSATSPASPIRPQRVSTVQFEEPFSDHRRHGSGLAAEPSPNTSDTEQIRQPSRAQSALEGSTQRRDSRPRRVSQLLRSSSGLAMSTSTTSPV